MTKEEAKYFSEVLKAYSEDKEIEYLNMDDKWVPKHSPNFDAGPFRYRIKPELKYRPYNSTEEFLKAQKEHGMYLISKNHSDRARLPLMIKRDSVFMFCYPEDTKLTGYTYSDLLNHWTHQDGTPCGILEEK